MTRHPILADTSGLIAIAMSECWDDARETLRVSTTNICEKELRRHTREQQEHAPEGSRAHRLYHGSERALDALEDSTTEFASVTVVPAPSGADAGEKSLKQELSTNPDPYGYVVLNDGTGRDMLRRLRDRTDEQYKVLPPTFLLYVLYDTDAIDKQQFCEACESMMQAEGWTNISAVHAMWEGIPVDCSGYIDERYLP